MRLILASCSPWRRRRRPPRAAPGRGPVLRRAARRPRRPRPARSCARGRSTITAAGVPLPLDGHQLLYRTADTHDAPEAAVATVILPPGEAPAGGRPLVAYQPAEDSLTRDCASSYEIRQGTNPELLQAVHPAADRRRRARGPRLRGPGVAVGRRRPGRARACSTRCGPPRRSRPPASTA